MKIRVLITVIFALIVVGVTIQSPSIKASSSLGRLVFTDYPKPDYNFTVDVYDLDTNKRSSAPRVLYDDVGLLAPIDTQHFYIAMCPAHNDSMHCPNYISAVIAPKDLHQFENIKQFWKENYSSPVWSPDGTHIAFIIENKRLQNTSSLDTDVSVMNADGTNILDLTSNKDDNAFGFTWSPDNRQLAFGCHDNQNLCIANIDGSQFQKLDVPDGIRLQDDPVWSPDGRQIVFSLLAKDSHSAALYLVNTDGSNMHLLLNAESEFYSEPKWSPDGSKIVFRSSGRNRADIYVINQDGTDLHLLSQVSNENNYGTVWSPDSKNIAFFSQHGLLDLIIYVADASRGSPRKIVDDYALGITDVEPPELFWIP